MKIRKCYVINITLVYVFRRTDGEAAMNKFKMLIGVSVLSVGLISVLNPISVCAVEFSETFEELEVNALGGWSEEDGYYKNLQAFSNAVGDVGVCSTVKHSGKAEKRTYKDTTQKRAHGWTTWVGVYHYTGARMADGDTVLTDSGRQWGNDGTEAISPWWSFDGETLGSARTYYGN